MPWGSAKVSNHLTFVLAAQAARERDLDEALLFDRDGYVVEGARTNLVVVGRGERPALPDLSRGGVAGIAREILLSRVPELVIRNVSAAEVAGADELIAINAVRGARPCIELDGAPVGDGVPGPWAARLDSCLTH
jgi:branched-subunit amino acid aminotransferase/4-amino-4-deoxychorismate lyase